MLDKDLNWNAHMNHIQASATKKIGVLSAVGGSNWGFGLRDLRELYLGAVLPAMTFCSSAWYSPCEGSGTKVKDKKVVATLAALQRRAGAVAGGAFRVASGPALYVELYTLLMKQRLQSQARETWLRMRSSETYLHVLRERRKRHVAPSKAWSRRSPAARLKKDMEDLQER